jgi:hypothetical protein
VTETPPVRAALDELREQMGAGARIELGELVIRGARQKAAELRGSRESVADRRRRLAEAIRRGDLPVDPAAADDVRRSGWARDTAPR